MKYWDEVPSYAASAPPDRSLVLLSPEMERKIAQEQNELPYQNSLELAAQQDREMILERKR